MKHPRRSFVIASTLLAVAMLAFLFFFLQIPNVDPDHASQGCIISAFVLGLAFAVVRDNGDFRIGFTLCATAPAQTFGGKVLFFDAAHDPFMIPIGIYFLLAPIYVVLFSSIVLMIEQRSRNV